MSQVLGGVSAVLAVLAVVVAFSPASGETTSWVMLVAYAVGLMITLVVWRWVPGFVNTAVAAVLGLMSGLALMEWLGVVEFGSVLFVVGLGIAASMWLDRWFPPEWLTRAMGLLLWLQGTGALMTFFGYPEARWLGRLCAFVLVVVGAWRFGRGGDWMWAVAAGLAAAMLAGLWSVEAVNAGVALIIAGLVMIATGLVLAGLRRAEQRG